MKSTTLLQVALSLCAVGNALDILPGQATANFPECGLRCATFQQAQGACGSQTPNLAAENCFCQFSLVQPFYASPDNVCPEVCTAPADRTTLKSWFTGFCSQVGAGVDPLADSTPSPTQGNSAPRPTYVQGGSTEDRATGSAWFKTHWQWLLMIIIVIIGLTAFGFLVRWLRDRHLAKLANMSKDTNKRRSKRLSELIMSSSEKTKDRPQSGTENLWGPHQHQAASQGFQYDMEHGNYPRGGARADTWRTEGKSNPSQVQTTELTSVRSTRTDSPHTGDRMRQANRI